MLTFDPVGAVARFLLKSTMEGTTEPVTDGMGEQVLRSTRTASRYKSQILATVELIIDPLVPLPGFLIRSGAKGLMDTPPVDYGSWFSK